MVTPLGRRKSGVLQTSGMRPAVERPYERKLRLLVTNQCNRHCSYCHNEGMQPDSPAFLAPAEIAPFLEQLRSIAPKVTLSGGEPLAHPNLGGLVKLLADHNFNITVITSHDDICPTHPIFQYIQSLHLSFHVAPHETPESGFQRFASRVALLTKFNPNLDLSINLLYDEKDDLCASFLDRYVSLMQGCCCQLKFVSLFQPPPLTSATGACGWRSRWGKLVDLLAERGYSFYDSTPRDVKFQATDGTSVTLSDIGCAALDDWFASGRCFDSMDVTITPDMRVKLCRWQGNSIAVSSLAANSETSWGDTLARTMEADANQCPFHSPIHPLAQSSAALARYVFERHVKWPALSRTAVDRVAQLASLGELSNLGASGVTATLEHRFASRMGLPYALSTASGTLALYLAYFALGFEPGDEVVVPVYSYPGTVTPLVHMGVCVRFCDVDPRTGNIDPESLASMVGARTKGVVVTHMWGCPAPLAAVMAICKRNGLRLIEDCSHALGAKYGECNVGTFGDVACFSLQANKVVCAGEGGILLTSCRDVFERAVAASGLRSRILDSVHGPLREYWETGTALKTKMHPLGAAIALDFLDRSEELNAARKAAALAMDAGLVGVTGLCVPAKTEDYGGRVYYTYKPTLSGLLIGSRDRIVERLIMRGLRMARSDMRPLNRTAFFNQKVDVQFDANTNQESKFPGADRYYRSVLSLPLLHDAPPTLIAYYVDELTRAIELVAAESVGGEIVLDNCDQGRRA